MLFVSKKKDVLLRGIPLVLFFAFAAFLSAQDAPPSSEPQELADAAQEAVQAPAPLRSRKPDESGMFINPPPASSEDAASNSGTSASAYSPAGAVLRLVVVLLLLCVACFFIIRFLRKSQGGSASSDPFLQVTASISLGQGKSVSVVTLGGRAFLLGVADHSVSLIAEITDAELIDQMNLNAGVNSASKKSFAEMLSDLIPRSRNKSGTSSSSFAEETADFIRLRRESLKGKEGGDE